jgi:hypothetical protein
VVVVVALRCDPGSSDLCQGQSCNKNVDFTPAPIITKLNGVSDRDSAPPALLRPSVSNWVAQIACVGGQVGRRQLLGLPFAQPRATLCRVVRAPLRGCYVLTDGIGLG